MTRPEAEAQLPIPPWDLLGVCRALPGRWNVVLSYSYFPAPRPDKSGGLEGRWGVEGQIASCVWSVSGDYLLPRGVRSG